MGDNMGKTKPKPKNAWWDKDTGIIIVEMDEGFVEVAGTALYVWSSAESYEEALSLSRQAHWLQKFMNQKGYN